MVHCRLHPFIQLSGFIPYPKGLGHSLVRFAHSLCDLTFSMSGFSPIKWMKETMRTIKLGHEEIELDEKILEFSETTLNAFLSRYAALYDYYVGKHALAQFVHGAAKDECDKLYAEKFAQFKNEGGSDKLADARATSDQEVIEAKERVRISKHHVQALWGFLRSMDRAHQNALQLGYNLRKELDKLFSDHIRA